MPEIECPERLVSVMRPYLAALGTRAVYERARAMMTLAHLALLAATATATATSSGGLAGSWALVDEPGALYVTLRPASLFGFLAHRHVVEARGFRGEVRYDPAKPAACRIEIAVPVSGLVVDRPALRAELGFDKELSEEDRRKVDANMRAENQLHADAHATIRFSARRCETSSDDSGQLIVTGVLEIRGATREVRVPVRVRREGARLEIESRFSERHESFGFEPYSTFAGAVKNDGEIRFHVRAHAERPD